MDPMKLQSVNYGVLDMYDYYEMMLELVEYIKSCLALREGLFMLLREASNAPGIVQMLDVVLTKSYYNHELQAFYKGMEPAKMAKMLKAYADEMKHNAEDVLYSSGKEMGKATVKSPYVAILK